MTRNEIMEMKVKDVLGRKVVFKNRTTKRINTGIVASIIRSNSVLITLDVKVSTDTYEMYDLKHIQFKAT